MPEECIVWLFSFDRRCKTVEPDRCKPSRGWLYVGWARCARCLDDSVSFGHEAPAL